MTKINPAPSIQSDWSRWHQIPPVEQVLWLVVHCSDSPYGNAALIDHWHKARGFAGIGYHYVILNCYPDEESWRLRRPRFDQDGVTERGRPISLAGAHAEGKNRHSLGICLIGRDLFTSAQFFSLVNLCEQLKREHPIAQIVGHYELIKPGSPLKSCPNIDMDYLRKLLQSTIF